MQINLIHINLFSQSQNKKQMYNIFFFTFTPSENLLLRRQKRTGNIKIT